MQLALLLQHVVGWQQYCNFLRYGQQSNQFFISLVLTFPLFSQILATNSTPVATEVVRNQQPLTFQLVFLGLEIKLNKWRVALGIYY